MDQIVMVQQIATPQSARLKGRKISDPVNNIITR